MTELSAFADAVTERRDADEILLGFTVALRAVGVPATHDRASGFLEAAALAGVGQAAATYHAGRATLCGSPADLERYDQVHEAHFGRATPAFPGVARPSRPASRRRTRRCRKRERPGPLEEIGDQILRVTRIGPQRAS